MSSASILAPSEAGEEQQELGRTIFASICLFRHVSVLPAVRILATTRGRHVARVDDEARG